MDIAQAFAKSLLDQVTGCLLRFPLSSPLTRSVSAQAMLGDMKPRTLGTVYISFYIELLFKFGPSGQILNSER